MTDAVSLKPDLGRFGAWLPTWSITPDLAAGIESLGWLSPSGPASSATADTRFSSLGKDLHRHVVGARVEVLFQPCRDLVHGAIATTASTRRSLPGRVTSPSEKPSRFQLLR